MSYIKRRAEQFAKERIRFDARNHDAIVRDVRLEISDIDSNLDKGVFLQEILTVNEAEYQTHLIRCREKETCELNFAHESIAYYLTQELNRLGITSPDQFTAKEVKQAEDRIEQLLQKVRNLHDEQSQQFQRIKEDLDELKELYFLGKKKWYQIFAGKAVEMVASGVVSATISEDIVKIFKEVTTALP